MDIADVFKNMEKAVLRRDELLNKLRKQIEELGNINDYEVNRLMNTVRRLRRSRRNLIKILSNLKLNDIDESFNDLVKTLAQFTLLVAVNDEEELVKEVVSRFKEGGVSSDVIRELEDDLREVNKLRSTLTAFLSNE